MVADLEEKAGRYGRLLDDAIDAATPAAPEGTPLAIAAGDCLDMARAYLDDGNHFRAVGDEVNALAAFAYGHGWLDAGARVGVLSVPEEGAPFTV